MEHNLEQESGDDSASANYKRDVQEDRGSVREALRTDLPAAHMGLGVTIVGLIVVTSFAGLRWALIVAAAFTVWFVLGLAVIHLGSDRGWDAVRRAYIATFGWGNWI
ncbi:hypothetical protein OG304_19005 [Streptomyces sp. NBC_00160]|uniref:hypothetical protein n=1 Tax=Streptomyces TaxID=1883 RepID=UPI00207ADF26|nr:MULTISPECIES: hypothetical protein [Streptomyces]MCM9080064.1 hypothetical protein [Streptomyces spororaveus]MCX5305519.1 hypothetical protein [Streptomyces sp. NBC_00160]